MRFSRNLTFLSTQQANLQDTVMRRYLKFA